MIYVGDLQDQINVLMVVTLFVGVPVIIALISIFKRLYRQQETIQQLKNKTVLLEEMLNHKKGK
jgi:hypothetical protein